MGWQRGGETMLFWEALKTSVPRRGSNPSLSTVSTMRSRRLPYDKRCVAVTKSGLRCRGRIREGTEFCLFHDPKFMAQCRRSIAANGGRNRRRLSHLPDGYLRKLKTRAAVGQAMDRLYREVRLGVISTEMGAVLFKILTRMLDSGLVESGPCPERTKAARIEPRLRELLTRAERAAWKKAVENNAASPSAQQVSEPRPTFEHAVRTRRLAQPPDPDRATRPLQAAS
jgi:hypothetical protein